MLTESDKGVCSRCKNDVGAELTKITDIKSQILAHAKISISKHLNLANVRDNERVKEEQMK